MSQLQIPVHKFLRVFDYLDAIGLDISEIANSANINLEQIRRLPEQEDLSVAQYSQLYKRAVEKMQDFRRPIPWAAGIGSESFELMCHCIIGAKTLGEALALAQRYDRLLFPQIGYRVSLDSDGITAQLRYYINTNNNDSTFAPKEWDRAIHQAAVAKASGLLVWYCFCGWLIGCSIEVSAVNIAAPFVNEGYAKGLAAVFNAPINFDAAVNAWDFPASYLDYRLVHSKDSLKEFLSNAVYQLIVLDSKPASTSSAIKSLISSDFLAGIPSIREVAEMLHTSESSLRRRLTKEGTNYQTLKDEVRCEIAVDMLQQGNEKIADIAAYVGFTEASSFVRSFKTWTGLTPKAYQEKAQTPAS